MVEVYLSDRGVKDFLASPKAAAAQIARLASSVGSLEKLCRHASSNIKRLKGCKTTVWRYRCGDFRIIFTASCRDSREFLIVHRLGDRKEIYRHLPSHFQELAERCRKITDLEQLEATVIEPEQQSELCPDTEFSNADRHYCIPEQILSSSENEETLIRYITSGQYLNHPCLTAEQEGLGERVFAKQARVYAIQGAAGTGKTTFAYHLAAQAAYKGLFPIVIVPNLSLKTFGRQALATAFPEVLVYSSERSTQPCDLAIFSWGELRQKLIGHRNLAPPMSLSEGQRRVQETLRCNPRLKEFEWVNLYALLLAFLPGNHGENYAAGSRDSLNKTYQEAIEFLETSWQEHYWEKLAGRDEFSQTLMARCHLNVVASWFDTLSAGKPILPLLDEVQDYYWFQLKTLLELFFSPSQSPSRPLANEVVVLGDENQRVRLSGFTWSALDAAWRETYLASTEDPARGNFLRLELSRNFRNTQKIAAAARYILLDAFPKDCFPHKSRHLPPPGDPSQCYEVGQPPRLLEVDRRWLEQLLSLLASAQPDDSGSHVNELSCRYVFIRNEQCEPWLLTALEQLGESGLNYTIAQAKGQEFEAVMVLFPFQLDRELTVENLFNWYTTITRARHYVTIFISSEERAWLERMVSSWKTFQQHFQVAPAPEPAELARELRREGMSWISRQQLQHLLVNEAMAEIGQWLPGGVPPQNLRARWLKLALRWWEFAQCLAELAEEQLSAGSEPEGLRVRALSAFHPEEQVVLYAAAWRWLQASNQDSHLLRQQALAALKHIGEPELASASAAREQIHDPALKSLLLQSWGYSWQAAKILKEYGLASAIEAIAEQLEQRSLPYEAARLRVQLLQAELPSYPYADVLEQEGPSVRLIASAFLASLEERLG